MIPYMETKGGAFYSDTERHLVSRFSRNNQSDHACTIGFRTFRPHRQAREPQP